MERYILKKEFLGTKPNTIFDIIGDKLVNREFDISLDLDMLKTTYFELYNKPNIDLKITNDIEEDDDIIELDWKMELKFKTTKKKMYNIQKFVYDNINDLL